MERILLIDGNALMFKSYFASAFLLDKGEGLDKNNEAINALRTFSMMIFNLTEKFPQHKMLIAFDAHGAKTYRSEHSFYKDGRKPTPPELIRQIPLIIKAIELANIEWLSSMEHEADDIIGILASKFSNQGNLVDIITTDKDLLQLVAPRVNVYISKTGVSEMIKYTVENFADLYYGLEPKQVIDMKGIMGDSSDNLPGIKGIGEKGSVKLLLEHGSIENVIECADQFTPSMRNKIIEGKEMGMLCKNIATIITTGDLGVELEQLAVGPANKEDLVNFLKDNSIFGLANRLEKKWS